MELKRLTCRRSLSPSANRWGRTGLLRFGFARNLQSSHCGLKKRGRVFKDDIVLY